MMLRRSFHPTTVLAVIVLLVGATAPAFAQADVERAQKSLYERLGGLAPISVVVSDFIDVMIPDEVLNQNPAIDAARKRVPTAYLKYHVTAMVCQATGGPCDYVGRGMKESHAHLNISADEWDRMVTLFEDVLAKHEVPTRERRELLEIVESTKADIVSQTGR